MIPHLTFTPISHNIKRITVMGAPDQCSSGEPGVLVFMWMLFDPQHTPHVNSMWQHTLLPGINVIWVCVGGVCLICKAVWGMLLCVSQQNETQAVV